MTTRSSGLTRRRLIRTGATVAALPGLPARRGAARQESDLAGSSLRILLPRRRLTGWEDALRNLANAWSQETGVLVRIDVVPVTDIPATVAAVLGGDTMFDLIGTDLPLLHHADNLHDLSPLSATAEERFGPPADVCSASTVMADGRQPSLSIAYGPAPLIYRRSVWEAFGLPEGPSTWDQIHETGAQIWHEEGMNLGFGLSTEPGSERFAEMVVRAYGGAMQDADGEIALNSPETVAAVRFAVELFRDAMSPESLDWQTDRPVDLLRDGIVSVICDDISAFRAIQGRNEEVANDLVLAQPPLGPASGAFGDSPASTYRTFHIPLASPNREAAESFLLMLLEASDVLTGASQLAERPAYASVAPGLLQTGGWLDNDPYGAMPPEKLAMLKSSAAWTTPLAAPAPANGVATLAHERFVLARMLARAARGEQSPEESVRDAVAELREIEEELRRVPPDRGSRLERSGGIS